MVDRRGWIANSITCPLNIVKQELGQFNTHMINSTSALYEKWLSLATLKMDARSTWRIMTGWCKPSSICGTFPKKKKKKMYVIPMPSLHLGVVAIEKGAFGSPSTMVTNFTFYLCSNCRNLFKRPNSLKGVPKYSDQLDS